MAPDAAKDTADNWPSVAGEVQASHLSGDAVLTEGSKAWYTGWNNMAIKLVSVIKVHYDDEDPFPGQTLHGKFVSPGELWG